MDEQRDLLFAFVAASSGSVSGSKLAAATAGWAGMEGVSLAEILVIQGVISAERRQQIEQELDERLHHYGGDLHRAFGRLIRIAVSAERRDAFLQFLNQAIVPTTQTQAIAQNPQAAGKLQFAEVIGEGGLGRVWLARDSSLGRNVAVKKLRPSVSDRTDVRERFLREMRITGTLEHPNIVPIYEAGNSSDDGLPYYAMRLLKGETLTAAIRAYHELGEKKMGDRHQQLRLLRGFNGVCSAVAYAHSRGIVHRDLKPDNVMLGEFGEVMVLDWGLAKRLDDPAESPVATDAPITDFTASGRLRTEAGSILGTPAFMAPEQAMGETGQFDERTDVYGLGAILFAVATGREPHRPLPGESRLQFLQRIASQPPPKVRSIRPEAAPEVEAICNRAMAVRPEDRYPNVNSLASDLESYCVGEPVSAFVEPPTQRIARWTLKHRLQAQLAGAVVAVLLIAAAILGVRIVYMRHLLENVLHSTMKERAHRIVHAVNANVRSLPDILRMLAQSPSATALLAAYRDQDPTRSVRYLAPFEDRLREAFIANPSYCEAAIAAVGTETIEIVRLESDPKSNQVVVTARSEAMNGARRKFFLETSALPAGQIRFLEIDDPEKLKNAPNRRLLAATPIVDAEGRHLGVVALAIDFAPSFDAIGELTEGHVAALLADASGVLLFESLRAKSPFTGNPSPTRIEQVLPDLVPFFKQETREASAFLSSTSDGAFVVACERCFPEPDGRSAFVVVLTFPRPLILHQSLGEALPLLAMSALLAALVIGIAILAFRVLTRIAHGSQARI